MTERPAIDRERLQEALAAMKKQAEAAEWLYADKTPATTARGHTALRDAQAAMMAHPDECQAIVRTVYALNSTIPDITLQQILAWLGKRESP